MFIFSDLEIEQRRKELFCNNLYKKIAFKMGEYVEDKQAQKSFSITSCDLTIDKQDGEIRFQLSEIISEEVQETWRKMMKLKHFSLDDTVNEFYQAFYLTLKEKVEKFFHYAIDIREYVTHRLRNNVYPEIIVHYYIRFKIEGNLFQLQDKLEKSMLRMKEYHFTTSR